MNPGIDKLRKGVAVRHARRRFLFVFVAFSS